jgi:flagellar M-ring protein FliF
MQFESFWGDLGKTQQAAVLIGAVVLLITLITSSVYFFSKEEYSVLFADLQEKDAATVLEALEKAKVSYSIGENGSQILVPSEEVHRTRLMLMGSDLPINGGVGFEIFNDSSFGTTEFAQKVNFQRALQGELTRTIMSLKEVKYARVHLVMPEGGLFKREGQQSSASVTLFLTNDMRPDAKQIAGIQRLISASVPKLEARNVTIVDQTGNVLNAPVMSEEVGLIQGELVQKRELEQYLKSKAMEVLGRAFELHQFAVSIDVTIDYNEATVTTENILPQDTKTKQGLLKSKELISSVDSDSTAQPRVTREEEYVVGRSVSKTIQRAGAIKKISIGVLVPESTGAGVVAELEQLVAMSVGIDRQRGDDVVVSAVLKESPLAEPGIRPMSLDDSISTIHSADSNTSQGALKNLGIETEYLIGVVVALVAFLLAIVIGAGFSRRKHDLSKNEREQLLLTLHSWVNAENKRDNIVDL